MGLDAHGGYTGFKQSLGVLKSPRVLEKTFKPWKSFKIS